MKNARYYAYTFLKQICLHKTYSNLLLRKELNKVNDKDKALVTQIVYGTLQNYRLCRYQWRHLVSKLPSDEVCIIMDMSVYQLLYMDNMPTYAVINEAVHLVRDEISDAYSGLCNAVLHKVEILKERPMEGTSIYKLALKTSHPEWLVNMWNSQYGFIMTCRICRANMETKPQITRVNTLKVTKEELLETLDFENAYIAEDALLYKGKNLIQSSYYQEGYVSIQDESSQLVTELLDPQPHEHILDVCSAPGTKPCHIAQRMQNTGHILCGDIHEHRVKLIDQGAQRLGITNITSQIMDATDLKEIEDVSFDRVLCDVPCSGYGVLAQKCDIKFHMQSEDMDTLIPLQREILERASQKVKANGVLVYSTCTLNKKENEKQVEFFLKSHPEFTLITQKTIFPHEYHSDGFFMAKFVRSS